MRVKVLAVLALVSGGCYLVPSALAVCEPACEAGYYCDAPGQFDIGQCLPEESAPCDTCTELQSLNTKFDTFVVQFTEFTSLSVLLAGTFVGMFLIQQILWEPDRK